MKTSVLLPYRNAFSDFMTHGALQSAAAMSFYAVAAIPPLVVVVVAVLSLVFSGPQAAAELVGQISALFGESTGQTVADIVQRRAYAPNGVAAITGLIALLLGASGFYTQLQSSLNQVWGVEAKTDAVWRMLVLKRLIGMTAVLGTGFLLLISLVVSAFLSAASTWLEHRLNLTVSLAAFTEAFVAMLTLTGMFAFLFKALPDVEVRWSDVWRGAITTSSLFLVGKFALGLYLGTTDFAADYGSAGALVLLLFWVYYTSTILLYGAALTQARATAKGFVVVPYPHAERVIKVRQSDPWASLQEAFAKQHSLLLPGSCEHPAGVGTASVSEKSLT